MGAVGNSRTAGRRWATNALLVVGLGAFAAYFVFAWDLTTGHGGWMSIDIYGYYYPNILHAVASLTDRGRGLLWNSLQDCGQPFFAIGSTGILYPLNALFLALDPDRALRAVIALNLVIAGLGAYGLSRELHASRLAAFGGALAFELANATLNLSTWTPLTCSPYVWFPTAMLFCERSLRAPSLPNAIGLGATLAVALLPGFPQTVFFAYQVIALRVLWDLALRRSQRPLAVVATIALGLALPPLLTAVQLAPAVEAARLSLRDRSLSPEELSPSGPLTWTAFRVLFGNRFDVSNPLIVVPAMLAAASLAAARTRRRALPYAVIGLFFFVLALGTSTPLFDLYARLPLSTLFRYPSRCMWVVDFCLAVLTGLGVDALRNAGTTSREYLRRALPLAVAALAFAALYELSPKGLRPAEWILGALLLGGAAAAAVAPAWSRAAAVVIVAAAAANLAAFPLLLVLSPELNSWSLRPISLRRLLHGQELYAGAPIFEPLRERLTPQDRVYLVFQQKKPALLPKVPGHFGIPGVLDYEPQPTQRYAAYLFMMRTGRQMDSINQYYFPTLGFLAPGYFQRRLLDLAAARYLVADEQFDTTAEALSPPPKQISSAAGLRLYDNSLALPRAFYVPRIDVVPTAGALLQRLADGPDDLRQVALVEELPPSGFTGVPGNVATGTVEFLRDDPEHLVLRVRAPERGFLHLADQYAPGWTATVNGAPAPIVRGDYLFRLVEVPKGNSIVEFVYRPMSLLAGMVISTVTVMAVGALLWRWRRRARS